MIKETELRIGNLVIEKRQVRQIFPTDYAETDFDLFNPIPLTEEWLVKLGLTRYARAKDYIEADENHSLDFVDLEDWTVYCAGSSGFFVGLKDGKLFHVEDHAAFDERAYIFPLGVELKSVHALQNRFYSMTGEELTIKEPV